LIDSRRERTSPAEKIALDRAAAPDPPLSFVRMAADDPTVGESFPSDWPSTHLVYANLDRASVSRSQ